MIPDISLDTVRELGVIGTLVMVGGSAIRWLLRDRKELLAVIAKASQRERELRDKRSEELLEQAELYAKSSEIIRDALSDVIRTMDKSTLATTELKTAFKELERKLDDVRKTA